MSLPLDFNLKYIICVRTKSNGILVLIPETGSVESHKILTMRYISRKQSLSNSTLMYMYTVKNKCKLTPKEVAAELPSQLQTSVIVLLFTAEFRV